MRSDELIRYKCLHAKAIHHNQTLLDAVDEGAFDIEGADQMTRNICAKIWVGLFDEIESYCGLLQISKRQFVESALIDLLEKTKQIFDDVDPFDEGGNLIEAVDLTKGRGEA